MALAVLVGVGAGVVMGLVAGARRTADAYPDFARAQRASDVLIAGRSDFGLVGAVDLDEVAALPRLQQTARATVSLLFVGQTDTGRRIAPVDVFPIMPEDDRIGRTIERWKIEEGRRADPAKVEEATASFVLAERLNLHVGSRMRLHFVKADSFASVAGTLLSQFGPRLAGESFASSIEALADGPNVIVEIVGIEASPAEFPPLGPDLSPALHLTPAFSRAYASEVVASPIMYVRLDHRSDVAAFAHDVERLAPGQPVAFIANRSFQTSKVQRSIDVSATALRLIAALLLLALVFVVGQALVRQAFTSASDHGTLRALGMTRAQLSMVVVGSGAIIGALGAVLGVVTAFVVSPLMPVGLARRAELDPGLNVDLAVFAIGLLATFMVVMALSTLAAWRLAVTERDREVHERRPLIDRAIGSAGVPPPAAVGLRFALDPGRGPSAVPLWTALVGAVLVLALLAGTSTFRSSLDTLLATEHLYGWNWTVKSGAPALPDLDAALVPAFEEDRAIDAISAGGVTQAEIGGERVDLLGMDAVRGHLGPSLVDGRLPRTDEEVVLGANTLENTGKKIGEIVTVQLGNRTIGMRVVGTAVFPEYGDASRLGDGAFMTFAGLQRTLPEANRNTFLLRLRPRFDTPREIARISAALEPLPTRDSGRPRELEDLADVQDLPTVLAGMLAVLAAAVLAHTLTTSIRRRRHDLAILKTIGFTRRQVALAVVWHATTLAAVALAIGVPIGLLAGRRVWDAFAEGLGAVSETTVPTLAILVTLPVTLLLANLIASVPAWVAGRTRPAAALRTE